MRSAQAGSAGATGTMSANSGDASTCWTLPRANRARLFPASGHAPLLSGGKIRGSNLGPTNGFVDLYTIASAPPEGQWLDVSFASSEAYRYVKYYSPNASYGAIAELELYEGNRRLDGKAFGTAGSRASSGNTYEKAFDGNPATYFEGPLADDNYAGLDLGADHELAAPKFSVPSGSYATAQSITLAAAPGATIRYTLDGTDPVTAGSIYTGPITVDRTVTLRAIATQSCMLASAVAQATYGIGPGNAATMQSSIHIGNSLTDTIVDHLDKAAMAGGIALDFHRYTIPGAGTGWLWDHPTGGFGETDVKSVLSTQKLDHLSMQPFPNGSCTPAGTGSESDYVNQFYALAKKTNPNVILWIYDQWPDPDEWKDCLSAGASWAKPPWTPPMTNPTSWDDAVGNQLAFQERVRQAVMDLNPNGKPIFVVPGGLALRDLKKEAEAGRVPGMSDFYQGVFDQNGTDLHLTEAGRYFITLVFYSCMFQKSPVGLTYTGTDVPQELAAKLQEIAWKTASSYALSGVNR